MLNWECWLFFQAEKLVSFWTVSENRLTKRIPITRFTPQTSRQAACTSWRTSGSNASWPLKEASALISARGESFSPEAWQAFSTGPLQFHQMCSNPGFRPVMISSGFATQYFTSFFAHLLILFKRNFSEGVIQISESKCYFSDFPN